MFTMIIALLLFCVLRLGTAAERTSANLYAILGVEATATNKELKREYRRKARETHPDKNTSVSAEEAAAAFREVVFAFEVLSDPERRRLYDTTGRTDEVNEPNYSGGGHGQYNHQQYHWHFHWHHEHHATHLRDTWEAQQAQSRMMHLVSMQQLQIVMLDDDDSRLERHLLICFVRPGPTEKIALDEMVFPYPFAGMSEQEIWWEDILQTMYVRLTPHAAPLADSFGISENDLQRNQPIFVYGREGLSLDDAKSFPRIQTTNRDEMVQFVWHQVKVEIEFFNGHDHPVELFWMQGEDPVLMERSLDPGDSRTFNSNLSHVWFARDTRVDHFKHPQERLHSFSDESVLMAFHILDGRSPQRLQIPNRSCFDLATDCIDWAAYGECERQGEHMWNLCPYSCEICEGEEIVHHLYEGHDEF